MKPYTAALWDATARHDVDAVAVADWLMAVVIDGKAHAEVLTPGQAQVACLILSKEVAGRQDAWIAEWHAAEAEAFS
jgi:hypothetical protein